MLRLEANTLVPKLSTLLLIALKLLINNFP